MAKKKSVTLVPEKFSFKGVGKAVKDYAKSVTEHVNKVGKIVAQTASSYTIKFDKKKVTVPKDWAIELPEDAAFAKGGKVKALSVGEVFTLNWHGKKQPINGVFPELIKKYIDDGVAQGQPKSSFTITSNMRQKVDVDKFLTGDYYSFAAGGKIMKDDEREAFRSKYDEAIKDKKTNFNFRGFDVAVDYAKELLDFDDNKAKKQTITKDQYHDYLREYDKLTDNYGDEDIGPKETVDQRIEFLSDEIHRYERPEAYKDGGAVDFSSYSQEELGKAYLEVVGYNPFDDDQTMTKEKIVALMGEYDVEAGGAGEITFKDYFSKGGKEKYSLDNFEIEAYRRVKDFFKEKLSFVEVWKNLSLHDKNTNHVYRQEMSYKKVGGKLWEVVLHYVHGQRQGSVGTIVYNFKKDSFTYDFPVWDLHVDGNNFDDGGEAQDGLILEYAQGGVTFDEKVEAIKKRLVGTKVPSNYRSEYGDTYSEKDADTAARKIAGAIVRDEQMAKGGVPQQKVKLSKEEKVLLMIVGFYLSAYKNKHLNPHSANYHHIEKIIDTFKTDPTDYGNLNMAVLFLMLALDTIHNKAQKEILQEKITELKAMANKYGAKNTFARGGGVGKNTVYSILKHPVSGPPTTIHSTKEFDKDDLQKRFDAAAKELQPGEILEYMKEDDYQFYPSILEVEMTDKGLISFTAKGHKRKYEPKFEKGGSTDRGYVADNFTLDGETNYAGYHLPSERWNGWATPVFEKDVAIKILEDAKIPYKEDGDKITAVTDWHQDMPESEYEYQELGLHTITVNGKEVNVYGPGAYEWVWMEASKEKYAKGGTIDTDTSLIPEIIADSVANEAMGEQPKTKDLPLDAKRYEIEKRLVEALVKRTNILYENNKTFHREMNASGNKGRDKLYMFMRHWAGAWIKALDSNFQLHERFRDRFGEGQLDPGKFTIEKGYFRGNKKFGRTTKLLDENGVVVFEGMGVVSKKDLLKSMGYKNSFAEGGDTEQAELIKKFKLDSRNDAQLIDERRKKFMQLKGITDLEAIKEQDREAINKEFHEFLDKDKNEYKATLDQQRKKNEVEFNALTKEQQYKVFEGYKESFDNIRGITDWVAAAMVNDGLIKFKTTRMGKGTLVGKGTLGQHTSTPYKTTYTFGHFKGEDTSNSWLSKKDDHALQFIFSDIDQQCGEFKKKDKSFAKGGDVSGKKIKVTKENIAEFHPYQGTVKKLTVGDTLEVVKSEAQGKYGQFAIVTDWEPTPNSLKMIARKDDPEAEKYGWKAGAEITQKLINEKKEAIYFNRWSINQKLLKNMFAEGGAPQRDNDQHLSEMVKKHNLSNVERSYLKSYLEKGNADADLDKLMQIADKIAAHDKKERALEHVAEASMYENGLRLDVNNSGVGFGRLSVGDFYGLFNYHDYRYGIANLDRINDIGLLSQEGKADIEKFNEVVKLYKEVVTEKTAKNLIKITYDRFFFNDFNDKNITGSQFADMLIDLFKDIQKNMSEIKQRGKDKKQALATAMALQPFIEKFAQIKSIDESLEFAEGGKTNDAKNNPYMEATTIRGVPLNDSNLTYEVKAILYLAAMQKKFGPLSNAERNVKAAQSRIQTDLDFYGNLTEEDTQYWKNFKEIADACRKYKDVTVDDLEYVGEKKFQDGGPIDEAPYKPYTDHVKEIITKTHVFPLLTFTLRVDGSGYIVIKDDNGKYHQNIFSRDEMRVSPEQMAKTIISGVEGGKYPDNKFSEGGQPGSINIEIDSFDRGKLIYVTYNNDWGGNKTGEVKFGQGKVEGKDHTKYVSKIDWYEGDAPDNEDQVIALIDKNMKEISQLGEGKRLELSTGKFAEGGTVSVSARKAELTKEIKATEKYLVELKQCAAKPITTGALAGSGFFWIHGDIRSPHYVSKIEADLYGMKARRTKMDKKFAEGGNVDLKGESKEHWMNDQSWFDESKNVNSTWVGVAAEFSDGERKMIPFSPSEMGNGYARKRLVEIALREGIIKKDIELGKISKKDSMSIITKAGLSVPNDIKKMP